MFFSIKSTFTGCADRTFKETLTFLNFFLLFLLRHDQHEIENPEDDQHHDDESEVAAATGAPSA
jgi:hypothetical protein